MKNRCEVIVIMDKSGSMASTKHDAIGGFNALLDSQKDDIPTTMTLVMFDNTYHTAFEDVPVNDVVKLTDATYTPGGMTALLDAVGSTIVSTGNRLRELPEDERPSKVLMAIITDGEENMSKEHTLVQVKQMIETQEKEFKWEFFYSGIGVDAFEEAGRLGIPKANTMVAPAGAQGVSVAYAASGQMLTTSRHRK